jgi:hypothetical protein
VLVELPGQRDHLSEMKPGRTFLSGTVAASALALPLVVAAQPA